MSRRYIMLLWAALFMIGLVAVACSDTGTETLVRRVSSPPGTHPADTSPLQPADSKKKKKKPADDDPASLNVPFRVSYVDEAPRTDGDAVKGCELTKHDIGAAVAPVSFVDAETAYLERRYGRAAELFRCYAEQHPDVLWGHFMHGLSGWKEGDLAEAEASFGRALWVDPDHLKSLQNLSRVLLERGRLEEASDVLRVAVDVDPTSNVTHRLVGRVLYAQGTVDQAVDAYRHAIVLDDEDRWAMNNLALIFIEQERYDEAIPPLARAVTLGDDVPTFHNNLGIALEPVGHVSSAAEAYRSALSVDPAYEKASMNLARVEVVRERPTSQSFDLDAVAQRFTDALLKWNVEAVVEP